MKNMKTLKIIVFAAVAMYSMASCSDEKKALNYVSEEIVSDNELNDFLIRYNILMFKDSFEPELRYYLKSISGKKEYYSYKIYLSDEFAHGSQNGWKGDSWEFYKPGNSVDSDIILNTILQMVNNKLDIILSNETVEIKESINSGMTKDEMFNYILSLAAHKSVLIVDQQMGEKRYNASGNYNWDLHDIYTYDWLILGQKGKQSETIDEIVNWIVSNCRDEVMSKNYKLVDKQCTTVGENQYNVTYLLEPQLEINFSVKKVGKTFVCENYSIDGNIINL